MTEGHYPSLFTQAAQGAGPSLWQTCVDQLAQELPEQQFNTWIKPLTAQVSDIGSASATVGSTRDPPPRALR